MKIKEYLTFILVFLVGSSYCNALIITPTIDGSVLHRLEDTVVSYSSESNISYTLNGNENFSAGSITVTRGLNSMTILDRNLGATSNDIDSSDSYGYYFHLSVNDNIFGWSGDTEENNYGYDIEKNEVINATGRQGPCPEGYHIPSHGEWYALVDLRGGHHGGNTTYSLFDKDLKIPTKNCPNSLRSSSHTSIGLIGKGGECESDNGMPIRCFKNPTKKSIIPTVSTGFVVTIGSVMYEGFTGGITLRINTIDEVEGKEVAGEVNIDFGTNENVMFSHPVEINIPVSNVEQVVVKVKHGGDSTYSFAGLTTNRNASCSNGEVVATSDRYNGETINLVDGYATVYSCAASSFIALGANGGEARGDITLTLTAGENTCTLNDYNLGTHDASTVNQYVESSGQEIMCEFLQNTGVRVLLSMDNLVDGEKIIGAENFTGIVTASGDALGSISNLIGGSYNLSGMQEIYRKSENTIGKWMGDLQIQGIIPAGTPSGTYTGTLEIIIQAGM